MDVLIEKRGIRPSVWGPCTWSMIHYVALAYPTVPDHQQQQDYKSFVESLQKVLPCQKCRDHMAVHLRETPVAVPLSKGKYPFFDWTVDLHNRVNADCGKPAYDPQVARAIYEHGYGCRGISPYMLFMCAIIVAILCFVLFLMYCAVLETRS
jgi:hypothetical protein